MSWFSPLSESKTKEELPIILIEENLINKQLPSEVLSLALNLLNPKDEATARGVCRRWNENFLASDKKEFVQLEQFIGFVTETLDQENNAIQIFMLERLTSDKKVLNTVSLQQIKMSVSDLKENILNVLKDLEEEELKKLEEKASEKKKMQFYHEIFDLVRIYKKIDEAKKGILDKSALYASLLRSCDELISKGAIDKALEIAKTIPDEEPKKTLFFESALEKLVSKKDVSSVTKLMLHVLYGKKTNDDKQTVCALYIQKLMEGGLHEAAAEINEFNLAVHLQYYELLSESFLRLKQYDLALNAVRKIPSKGYYSRDFSKNSQYKKIALALLGKDNDKAMKVAKCVKDEKHKYYMYHEMSEFFRNNNEYRKDSEVFDILRKIKWQPKYEIPAIPIRPPFK